MQKSHDGCAHGVMASDSRHQCRPGSDRLMKIHRPNCQRFLICSLPNCGLWCAISKRQMIAVFLKRVCRPTSIPGRSEGEGAGIG